MSNPILNADLHPNPVACRSSADLDPDLGCQLNADTDPNIIFKPPFNKVPVLLCTVPMNIKKFFHLFVVQGGLETIIFEKQKGIRILL